MHVPNHHVCCVLTILFYLMDTFRKQTTNFFAHSRFYASFWVPPPPQKTTPIDGSCRLLKQHLGNALQSTPTKVFCDVGGSMTSFFSNLHKFHSPPFSPPTPKKKKQKHLGVIHVYWSLEDLLSFSPKNPPKQKPTGPGCQTPMPDRSSPFSTEPQA